MKIEYITPLMEEYLIYSDQVMCESPYYGGVTEEWDTGNNLDYDV